MMRRKIPFSVKTERVLELFAKQIYQSPLALLRENTQNAYDAILQREHLEGAFEGRIEITVEGEYITIEDNGIGMTADQVRDHYWRAGSSGKDTDEARAAGVVGTFGIGAMASFGIADELVVETESTATKRRTWSRAILSELSLNDDCIDLEEIAPTGNPGTKVTAHVMEEYRHQIGKAETYLTQFVRFLDPAVKLNGKRLSGQRMADVVPRPAERWRREERSCRIGPRLVADVSMIVSRNAEIWLGLGNVIWSGREIAGSVTLLSNRSALQTYRSGFGLATATVSSVYGLGGVADLRMLQPTAGREALTAESAQLLQSMMSEIDEFVSKCLASEAECDASPGFLTWVANRKRFDMCGHITIEIQPGDRITLNEVKDLSSQRRVLLYGAADRDLVALHASEDVPVLVLAPRGPRRRCQRQFLTQFCNIKEIQDAPTVHKRIPIGDLTVAQSALKYRIEAILERDYFLKQTAVQFGKITHGLPLLTTQKNNIVELTFDPDSETVSLMLSLYDNEYSAFGSMAKDYVRSIIFPRVAEYVPSSQRQGAEAFLKAIRRSREVFEYEDTDLGSLPQVWADYQSGRIDVKQAVQQSMAAARLDVQIVDHSTTASVEEIVPDVVANQGMMREATLGEVTLDALPAVNRLDVSTDAKLLMINREDPALSGYRCFVAITKRARTEVGEFFLQPHKTSVVWGGQRVLFIFVHQSGRFGLYYDLQTRGTIAEEADGGPYPTCTIVLKNQIYIPVPDAITAGFVPSAGERKRFEIRHDFLRVDAGADV